MFQKHEGGATMRIAIVDDIKEERAVLYGWLSNQLLKRNIPGDFEPRWRSPNIAVEKNFWRQQKNALLP